MAPSTAAPEVRGGKLPEADSGPINHFFEKESYASSSGDDTGDNRLQSILTNGGDSVEGCQDEVESTVPWSRWEMAAGQHLQDKQGELARWF